MPRSGERGGSLTRARIAEVANALFLERGFDAVTVAEVARAAGVSSVTVFKHFPRKEDLFLDRAEDAAEILSAAVRDRGPDVDVLDALRATTLGLVEQRHPLSGVDPRSLGFFATVAASPLLVARAREIAADLERGLAADLAAEGATEADPDLLAALFLAGYANVLVRTARRLLDGAAPDDVLADHRAAYERLFVGLRDGVLPRR